MSSIIVNRLLPNDRILNKIRIGNASVKPGNVTEYSDPYATADIKDEGQSIDLIQSGPNISHVFTYDAKKPICDMVIKVWPIYRVWHLKEILSAYIGCPASHIDTGDDSGEFIRPVSHYEEINIKLAADWNPEMASLETIRRSERMQIMSKYLARDKIFEVMKEKHTHHGDVTQTELVVSAESDIDFERVFALVHLDIVTKNYSTLTAISHNDGTKVRAKVLSGDVTIHPPPNGLSMILLIPFKGFHHPFFAIFRPGFHISIRTNWSIGEVEDQKTVMDSSKAAYAHIMRKLGAFFPVDILKPGATMPKNPSMALSIVTYRENYIGGNFDKLKDLILQLAQTEYLHVTYITTSSLYFSMHRGWSVDRLSDLKQMLIMKGEEDTYQSILVEALSMKGPEIQFKAEQSDLFVIVSGCNGDEEIDTCGKLAGGLVLACGYKPSTKRTDQALRDYANLNLLEQIDPILFGPRDLPGGERINYSRECQGAARHPIPISMTEAKKTPGAIILNNITYGGPQAYKASKEFPIISFRPLPFQRHCLVCCVQKELDKKSLRWDEYTECAKTMLYEQNAELESQGTLQGNVLQFDGSTIVRGRRAAFPRGVRELLPASAMLYSPMEANAADLHSIIEWTVGYPVERQDSMMAYAMHGVPVAFMRLIPSTKKVWRASVLDLGSYYDIPPYVIAFWVPDEEHHNPISFHPVMDINPMTTDELGIEIGYAGHGGLGVRSERLFTFDILNGHIPGYSIVGTYIVDGYCHAVELEKNKGRFLVPVRPSKIKPMDPIDLGKVTIPTIKQVTDLMEDMKKAYEYVDFGARVAVFNEKNEYIAMLIIPDGVLIHFRPTKSIPFTPTRTVTISKEGEDILWGRTEIYHSAHERAGINEIALAEKYIAAKVLLTGSLEKAVKDIRIGKFDIPLKDGNVILFSGRASMPKQLINTVVDRLRSRCPKKLENAFYLSFGTIINRDKIVLEDHEKLL